MSEDASEPANAPPPRLRQMQEGDPHRGGNVLVLVGDEGEAQVLKIYRRRGTRAQEWSRALSHLFIEGKRGAGARARRDTERLCLTLWAAHGFDVFTVFDLPPPSWIAHPTLWIEYCPGRSLLWAMLDASVPWEQKLGWLRRLASDMARRHALALRLGEPLLVQEHGTVNHVPVSGERLIPFDFEVAYRAGYPVLRAVSTELGGYLRSVQK
ncbi:MAG: hypothetical protein K8I02_08570, partial [Candidatus Methylomirabilis sp.]|nr:hypothetical protein [Deltaproteobacteria bacterium]